MDRYTLRVSSSLRVIVILLVGVACAASPTAAPAPEPLPTGSPLTLRTLPTAPPTATIELPAATPMPAPTPPVPAALLPYTLDGLRARLRDGEFPGGPIQRLETVETAADYTRYRIAYPSDGLTIMGTLQAPRGQGPFPVIILLHGYVARQSYWPGIDTWQAAGWFNQHGYLTIAPDLRSWGGSDDGPNLFHTGLVADVLNLIGSLSSLPEADPTRLGLWGHSMGGGVTTKVLVIDDRVDAAVLYAPNSANDADLVDRWGPGCLPGQSREAGDRCNAGEFIPEDLPSELLQAYLAAAADSGQLRAIAPIYELNRVRVPVQIHIGLDDGEGPTETPPLWSLKLYDALQAAGRDVTYYEYPGQGHYFVDEAWALLLQRSLELFDRAVKEGPVG